VDSHITQQKAAEKEKAIIAQILHCKENGLAIPPELLPKTKEKKVRMKHAIM
jgi:hypothetical protein